jgi:N-acetylmuramoyl-L-alanine amidase
MVKGACRTLHTDYAIAATGIAGPSGGTKEIPVGTIWLACGSVEKIVTMKVQEDHGRDINLAIGLKLRALAELYGQDNVLIRQDDSTKCDYDTYSEHRDLECRTELTCAEANPVYVSIHQNDYPTGQPSGSQVIYAVGQGSRELGTITHANLINALYPKCRRVAEPATKRLYILSHLDCPAILVECGFVSNPVDLENLKKPGYQTSIAAILMGSYLQFTQNTVRI